MAACVHKSHLESKEIAAAMLHCAVPCPPPPQFLAPAPPKSAKEGGGIGLASLTTEHSKDSRFSNLQFCFVCFKNARENGWQCCGFVIFIFFPTPGLGNLLCVV